MSEETLDPDNWESMRKLGHKMLDDMVDYLKTVRERPVWQNIPEQVKTQFTEPVPVSHERPEEVYKEFTEKVLPYPMGNFHPRFWGWILGTGTIMGAYSELLAASMNTNNGGGDHIAVHVEKQVLDWIKEMLQFPASASGVLTSGCSASNLIGLTVARNTKAGFDLRRKGLRMAPGVWCSTLAKKPTVQFRKLLSFLDWEVRHCDFCQLIISSELISQNLKQLS